jgi:hypothetical protein
MWFVEDSSKTDPFLIAGYTKAAPAKNERSDRQDQRIGEPKQSRKLVGLAKTAVQYTSWLY